MSERSALLQCCIDPAYKVFGGVLLQYHSPRSLQRNAPCRLFERPKVIFQSPKRRKVSRNAANDQQNRLKQAAKEYAEGVERGIDEDDIVAMQLGAADISELTDRQQQYVEKIKTKLAQQAEEARQEKDKKSIRFTQGKRAYSVGQYAASEVLFQDALDMEGEFSPLGGEIQLWLALSYQACGKEQECIELYKSIQKNHPLPKVRRQAGELRYIMEAPKLRIGPDEKVSLPILEDQSRFTKQRGISSRTAPKPPALSSSRKRPKSLEEEFWENYKPPIPEVVKNRYFLIASGVVATGLAYYSVVLNKLTAAK